MCSSKSPAPHERHASHFVPPSRRRPFMQMRLLRVIAIDYWVLPSFACRENISTFERGTKYLVKRCFLNGRRYFQCGLAETNLVVVECGAFRPRRNSTFQSSSQLPSLFAFTEFLFLFFLFFFGPSFVPFRLPAEFRPEIRAIQSSFKN